jgi:hypothetical protein
MVTVVLTGWMAVCSDRDTCRWDTTIPALEQIERQGIPLVLVTRKTRAEAQGLALPAVFDFLRDSENEESTVKQRRNSKRIQP